MSEQLPKQIPPETLRAADVGLILRNLDVGDPALLGIQHGSGKGLPVEGDEGYAPEQDTTVVASITDESGLQQSGHVLSAGPDDLAILYQGSSVDPTNLTATPGRIVHFPSTSHTDSGPGQA